MEKSTRKLRFERVSQNRLQRALEAIDSLENLSNKSNYDWDQEQIDEISGVLMSKVKHVMASFGSSSPKDRFDKLLKQDQIQHRLLRLSDPEVAKMVDDHLRKHGQMASAAVETDSDIVEKFKKLYIELTQQNLKKPRQQNHLAEYRYKLDPKFDVSRLSAKHNIDRLNWLGAEGKTYEQIIGLNSKYRIHPDPSKKNPTTNLKWDINQGRVIKITQNS
tara:strand:- start:254 stop:910 length:657 start_codon:yes stop_codon:yes gene_type:complete